MGGFASVPGLQTQLQQQQPTIEQSASQAPQQLAQSLQNNQQQAAQSQQGQPQGQQDDDPIRQQLLSKVQQASNAKFGVKQMLQNFFGGMAHGMLPAAQTPEFQQQRALTNLATYDTTQANLKLHQSMASQYAPTPLVGLDGKPVTGPDGKQITLPANHAATWYAGQTAAASRIQVQGMKGDTSTEVQGLKNQATVGTHPLQQVLNDAAQAYQSGDMETYQNKLAEASQLSGTSTAAARSDKLDQFHQTQQYNVWKTNQDNQTKLQVAQMSGIKAPAAIMQTAAFAQGGLSMLNDAEQAMQRLEARGVLGNVASDKIEDWIFGKGLVDPTLPAQDKQDIGKLRAAATYTSSAAMRAHTGRSSREIYDDFKNTMGINQGPDAWKGAMQETRSMLGQYSQGASDAAIASLRGRTLATPSSPQGGQGNARTPSFKEWKAQQRP